MKNSLVPDPQPAWAFCHPRQFKLTRRTTGGWSSAAAAAAAAARIVGHRRRGVGHFPHLFSTRDFAGICSLRFIGRLLRDSLTLLAFSSTAAPTWRRRTARTIPQNTCFKSRALFLFGLISLISVISGQTALMSSSRNGQLATTRFLVERRADVAARAT